jgi:type IV pilus assembly protein PilC
MKKLPLKTLTDLIKQLHLLLKAGIPLVQAFMLLEQEALSRKEYLFLRQIRAQLEKGRSLSESLAHYPVDTLLQHSVAAGEYSGTLDTILENWVAFQENSHRLRQKVQRASLYPALVLLVSFGLVGVLVYGVLPSLESLFQTLNTPIPPLTQFVLKTLKAFPPVGLWGVGLLFLYLMLVREHLWLDRLPLLGPIRIYTRLVHFLRPLALLFSAGIPIIEALTLCAPLCPHLTPAIAAIQQKVTRGEALHTAFQQQPSFPPLIAQRIAVGEYSGSLDVILWHLTHHYEAILTHRLESGLNLLEPILMICLSGVVGGLMVALYLPLFSIGQTL